MGVVPTHAESGPRTGPFVNQDRPGTEYRHFEVSSASECQNACAVEANCRSWTYKHFGLGLGQCGLKATIPQPRYDTCCISGLKPPPPAIRGEGVPPRRKDDARGDPPPPVVKRYRH
ncbi:MAG: PAN domain-containing protein [Burkholderiaceae bacterium]